MKYFSGFTFAIALLAGCQSASPPVTEAASMSTSGIDVDAYRALAASGNGTVYTIDAANSRVLIYAFRGGAAAFAGHNHVITAEGFSGYVFVPRKGLDHARFDLEFPLDRLNVDDAEARRTTGGTFAGTLAADAIAGTREHMLGERGLDAAHFPALQVHSVRVFGEAPKPVAQIAIQVHGRTRELLVPLDIETNGAELKVKGSIALRQTDFGLVPYSVLNGLLSVQDEVAIGFALTAAPASFGPAR